MQKSIFFLFIFLLPLIAKSQFSDDFSDGNLSANPQWIGDTEKFMVEDGILRLNDNAAGQAYLATASHIMHNTQWEFWVRLAFTPSNNNHPRIYLVSDNQDLSGSLNGYYLRIGKDGGDNKRLYFYRQDGTVEVEIMAGATNLATTTNNRLRIRVMRDEEGNWSFFADPTGGSLFVPQGTVKDNTHTVTSWFGIRCMYTVSNANRFYFDDFSVGEDIPDTDPPEVELLQVTSSNSLNIYFSEVVETSSAENTSNYTVNPEMGHPLIASRNPDSPNQVSLLFAEPFIANQEYSIQISQIEDYAGNVMSAYAAAFVYFVPQPFSVVFNELMINPTPVVGLPAYEYIELYNTTNFSLNLEGWVFQHGNTRRTLPLAHMEAKGLVLLVTETAYPFFQDHGNVVAVPGLSGTALTNAGTDLMLFDPEDRLIAFVSYTDEWYQDASKNNGGWSLEKMDPYNFCQGMENWKASISPQGGTPGGPNSVFASNPDLSAPVVLRAGVENNQTVVLYFSESMDADVMDQAAHFQMDQGIGTAQTATPLLPDFKRVRLQFGQPMQEGRVYQLEVSAAVTDCAGNSPARRTTKVGLPQDADSLDVVINEVLFNPPDQGARYIELYNRSKNIIDLQHYQIMSKDTLNNVFTTIQEISEASYLFFPDDYLVLTTNPAAVKNTFMTPNPDQFIRLSAMPRMTNAGGILVFASRGLQVIDQFVYEEDMQLALFTSFKGVALERLNPDWPTQDCSNWHSAAQSAGFGTPAYKNSQYTVDMHADTGQVEIHPEVFSPDGDGQDDLLQISYAFDQPGFVANVKIFDSRGRLIRTLKRGELLATSGVITWDGLTDDHQKAAIGIYLVHLEVFDLTGKVKNYRKTAVLGGRL